MAKQSIENKDSVLIRFGHFNGLDEIHEVDRLLFDEIPQEIGRHDGHEVAMYDGHGTFFAYEKNAETLYKTIEPILDRFDFLNNANVEMNFYRLDGDISSIEIRRQKVQ